MLFQSVCFFFFFFFSSRRRHTRYIGDWSSDVCSSDLARWAACLAAWPQAATRVQWIYVADRESDVYEEIGRASCRERVEISVGAGSVKEKEQQRDGYQPRTRKRTEQEEKDEHNRTVST